MAPQLDVKKLQDGAALVDDEDLPGSIVEAGDWLETGRITSEALVAKYLDRIHRLNPTLHALITISGRKALDYAVKLDAERAKGRLRGPLHGIPIVHKDLLDTAGIRTTVGSELYQNRVPDTDAAVVRCLADAGAISLGKTNLSEFATHPSGKNKFYGDARNPIDLDRAAGGSSGGTAAAIAAKLCLGGTGSDTGGSIRIPASWCGIVGLRPTFGLVDLAGCYPRAYSLDVCGPMAGNVTDCALLLGAMVKGGQAGNADLSSRQRFDHFPIDTTITGLRLGVIDQFTYCNSEPATEEAVRHACRQLESVGLEVKMIQMPFLADELQLESMMKILLYEFNEVLRPMYEGVEGRERLFDEVVIQNLTSGAAVSVSEYEQAMEERVQHYAAFQEVFKQVDLLITPTVPVPAPRLDAAPEVWERTRRYTLPFSYLGVPAISVPCGSECGLPVGIQLVSDRLEEALLLRVALGLERALS